MRPTLVLAVAAALAATLASGPARADRSAAATAARPAAATTLGQVGTGACNVGSPAAVVIGTEAAGAASYVATTDGVLTSFSHQANGTAGQIQAIVFADGASPSQKTVVAKSPKVTVTRNVLNTVAVRLPIKAGQRLGLGYTASTMACATAADLAGDTTLVKAPFNADTTSTFVADGILASGTHTFRPNISAVLEPDADGDGYGDVSQDACPQSALSTAACPPPDTAITKKPKQRSTRTKAEVKVKFGASIPGSSFQCKLDGHRKWKGCPSPWKKRLGPGRHVLVVRAVSPAGIPDHSPARVRFTILRA